MPEEHATQIIPDLSTNLVNMVRKVLELKIRRGGKPVGTHNGVPYYAFGDIGTGYIALYDGVNVLYFVRHKKVNHNGLSLGRQVLLWRDPTPSTKAAGFAQTVFFNILLPKYTALISDKEQTRNGKEFWSNAIIGAHARSLHVYYLDRASSPNKLLPILNSTDLHKYDPLIWGTSTRHTYTFAVISKSPLSIVPKNENRPS
jgi:hypothetical protein